jgi:hypothetical protein
LGTANINSAFRLRNRLKEKIQRLNFLIVSASYEKEAGTEENCTKLDGRTLQETIAQAASLMNLLCDFNKEIEKVNEVNRASLTTLESVKAKIALYEQITESCRACKGYEDEYREVRAVGYEKVRVIKELVLDQALMVKELDALKKEKNQLEEKLSRSNYETKVDFDTDRILPVL